MCEWVTLIMFSGVKLVKFCIIFMVMKDKCCSIYGERLHHSWVCMGNQNVKIVLLTLGGSWKILVELKGFLYIYYGFLSVAKQCMSIYGLLKVIYSKLSTELGV